MMFDLQAIISAAHGLLASSPVWQLAVRSRLHFPWKLSYPVCHVCCADAICV